MIDIHLPPLRERLDDLPALCESLLARIAEESGIEVPRLSPSMLEQICLAPLKGNVRELENLLHRAVALSEGNDLQVEVASQAYGGLTVLRDVALRVPEGSPPKPMLCEAVPVCWVEPRPTHITVVPPAGTVKFVEMALGAPSGLPLQLMALGEEATWTAWKMVLGIV